MFWLRPWHILRDLRMTAVKWGREGQHRAAKVSVGRSWSCLTSTNSTKYPRAMAGTIEPSARAARFAMIPQSGLVCGDGPKGVRRRRILRIAVPSRPRHCNSADTPVDLPCVADKSRWSHHAMGDAETATIGGEWPRSMCSACAKRLELADPRILEGWKRGTRWSGEHTLAPSNRVLDLSFEADVGVRCVGIGGPGRWCLWLCGLASEQCILIQEGGGDWMRCLTLICGQHGPPRCYPQSSTIVLVILCLMGKM